MPRRIYAVATGQNQANLPPILSLASQGDCVVWLETPLARERRWAEGANAVLESRGIPYESIPIGDSQVRSPQAICELLLEERRRHPTAEPVFVLNGGQKHMVLGVGLARQQGRLMLVYSDVRPAQLWLLGPDDSEFRPASLENPLRLDEWLLANGLVILPGSLNHQLWPPAEARTQPARLGSDSAQAFKLPNVQDRIRGSERLCARWQDLIHKSLQNCGVRLPRDLVPQLAKALAAPQGSLLSSAEAFFRRCFEQALEEKATLGHWFEGEVSRALVEFLTGHPQLASVVVEARRGLVVARAGTPEQVFAEYDIALLLKNATLIHLECKAGTLEEKDMFARLAKLHEAGGLVAQQVVCVHFRAGDEVETRQSHQLLQQAERICRLSPNFRLLAHGAPGVPVEYNLDGTRYRYDNFQEGMRKLLEPYCPRELARS